MAEPVLPYRKYGFRFKSSHPIEVEKWMIRNTTHEPFTHYKALQQALWPELDYHRWTDLCLQNILSHRIAVLLGAGSTGKTHEAAKFSLSDYWVYPEQTTILMSSTDIRGLRLRIWGEVKKLYQLATERWPDFEAGRVLEGSNSIVTENAEDEEIRTRDDRNGIICIPCLISGRYIGLGKYAGIKNKRVRLMGDELQFMGSTFLESISNLNHNPDFKAVLMGNPVDPMDQLGKAAEPAEGWSSIGEPAKTICWKTRFMDGICINLVGTDSPNFDGPQDPPRYPYLTNQKKIDAVVQFWGKDSLQYSSQCLGVMKSSVLGRRVLTREMVVQHHGFDEAVWRGEDRTRIYAVDVAYGGVGGDRCVGGWIEFGYDMNGGQILRTNQPTLIPVIARDDVIPEDQIAEYVYDQMKNLRISPQNIFYDSTGRGSIGSSFARVFGSVTPVPIEFGGRPSMTPVRSDLYIYDERTREKRLKRCDEHYSKRVTEFWYNVRYAVEADQVREFPEDVLAEFCMREWGMVLGNKIQLETKEDTRERTGRSPDLADWCAVAVEGARQRGFYIKKLGTAKGDYVENNVLADWSDKWQKIEQSKRLTFKS